jgi:hypothetical protein
MRTYHRYTIIYRYTPLSSPGHNASWPYQTAFELPAQTYNTYDEDKTVKLLKEVLHLKVSVQ